ncbi:hypothetical protein V8E55_011829 [Tylopilus felleus]
MGLAGRKHKQRIPADLRNLSWADGEYPYDCLDSSHIPRSLYRCISFWPVLSLKIWILTKAQYDEYRRRTPTRSKWKQNKELEALLKRLNETSAHGMRANGKDAEGENMKVKRPRTRRSCARAEKIGGNSAKGLSVTTTTRKHEDGDDPDSGESRGKKKRAKPSAGDAIQAASASSSVLSPCPTAHRARMRATKHIAGKSASTIAEILGIAPFASVFICESTPAPTPPSSSTPMPQPSLSLNNLTTSTKSVADYFKERLVARSSSSSSPSRSGLGRGLSPPEDESELSRRGIGSQVPVVLLPPQVPEAG